MTKFDVLIDGMYLQNILNSFNLFGSIDYEKLSNKFAENDERDRTYYFDALPLVDPNKKNKQRFIDKLRYLNSFQVELGYIKPEVITCSHCGADVNVNRQKKVDILMATRIIERAEFVQRIVILAGDADFVPAVEVAKKKAKITLAYAQIGTIGAATELKQVCDTRFEMTADFFENCKLARKI